MPETSIAEKDRAPKIPFNQRRHYSESERKGLGLGPLVKFFAGVGLTGITAYLWYTNYVMPHDEAVIEAVKRTIGSENQPRVQEMADAPILEQNKDQERLLKTVRAESGDNLWLLISKGLGVESENLANEKDFAALWMRDGQAFGVFTSNQAFLKASSIENLLPQVDIGDEVTTLRPAIGLEQYLDDKKIKSGDETMAFLYDQIALGNNTFQDRVIVYGGSYGDGAIFLSDAESDGWQVLLPDNSRAPAADITGYMNSDTQKEGFEHTFDQAVKYYQSLQTANN